MAAADEEANRQQEDVGDQEQNDHDQQRRALCRRAAGGHRRAGTGGNNLPLERAERWTWNLGVDNLLPRPARREQPRVVEGECRQLIVTAYNRTGQRDRGDRNRLSALRPLPQPGTQPEVGIANGAVMPRRVRLIRAQPRTRRTPRRGRRP